MSLVLGLGCARRVLEHRGGPAKPSSLVGVGAASRGFDEQVLSGSEAVLQKKQMILLLCLSMYFLFGVPRISNLGVIRVRAVPNPAYEK